MFKQIEIFFFYRLTILSTLSSVNLLNALLKCISMNNQECKVRLKIPNISNDEPVFFLLVLKQVNAVIVVIISMIHMQNCVFLMLLNI